ncbi:poly(3-hydroxybutyrate) depolymerase (plasmid) [Sinorhizobium meliloti]|nr:poly(3-hydroxybutyrate) depolymerase [Sinorhizobium meliloti]
MKLLVRGKGAMSAVVTPTEINACASLPRPFWPQSAFLRRERRRRLRRLRPCPVEGGSYRIEMPEGGKPKGAYVFFHGYRSSAELQMRHRALVDTARPARPGLRRGGRGQGTWSHPNAPGPIAMKQPSCAGFSTTSTSVSISTRSNTLVGGFSQGASMAWYSLCRSGDRLAGAVTFSGVFWNPLPKPEDCVPDLPPIIHFHGRQDGIFPLAGKAIGSRFHQGDTFKTVAFAREAARCEGDVEAIEVADLSCTVTVGCVRGEVTLCLYDGGHQVRPEYLDRGLTRLGF